MVEQAPAASDVVTGSSVNVVIVGILAVFAKAGITSWGELAGLLACILTLTHLCILWWKVMWRPMLIRFGWLKRARRAEDAIA